jgi:hypothetical protein
MLVLILRAPDIYLDGNNVTELNGNNRRDIIVGIRVVGIRGAGSRPGKKNRACEHQPAYPPMCQQEHLCLALHDQEGMYFGGEPKITPNILADVAKEEAAIKSAAGISKIRVMRG